jgi:tetratricopeptide (TPR) repeat protein
LATCVAVLAASGATARVVSDDGTASLIAQMDALWAQRAARDVMPELMALGTQGLTAAPDNYEIQWRMARGAFWVAFTQSNRVTRKAMAGSAADWADRARMQRPDRVEGQYFYAAAIGAYGATIGAMQAVIEGIAGKFENAATRAYEIDRDFENGAPITMLGRYYYMLPWPKRDLTRSRQYLEEAAARHPRKLISRVYLAETYYELDEREKARAELEFVLENDPEPGTEDDRPAPKPLALASLQHWFPDAAGRHGNAGR